MIGQCLDAIRMKCDLDVSRLAVVSDPLDQQRQNLPCSFGGSTAHTASNSPSAAVTCSSVISVATSRPISSPISLIAGPPADPLLDLGQPPQFAVVGVTDRQLAQFGRVRPTLAF